MTQDKQKQDKPQPITEDDFVLESDATIQTDFREFCIRIIQVQKNYKLATKIKHQILDGLKALEELPKLKTGYDLWMRYVVGENLFLSDLKQISKLKAENEELKRQLQK